MNNHKQAESCHRLRGRWVYVLIYCSVRLSFASLPVSGQGENFYCDIYLLYIVIYIYSVHSLEEEGTKPLGS